MNMFSCSALLRKGTLLALFFTPPSMALIEIRDGFVYGPSAPYDDYVKWTNPALLDFHFSHIRSIRSVAPEGEHGSVTVFLNDTLVSGADGTAIDLTAQDHSFQVGPWLDVNNSTVTSNRDSVVKLDERGIIRMDNGKIIAGENGEHGVELRSGYMTLTNGSEIIGNDVGLLWGGGYFPNQTNTSIGVDNGSIISGRNGPAVRVEDNIKQIKYLNMTNDSKLISGTDTIVEAVGENTLLDILFRNTTIEGDVVARNGAEMLLWLDRNANFTGNVRNATHMTLSRNSTWYLPADNDLQQLELDADSKIVFGDGSAPRTLTANDLYGGGHFYMNAWTADNRSDFLRINNRATGDYYLHFTHQGSEPGKNNQPLNVAHIAGGDASFYLPGGSVDLGTWQYTLVQQDQDYFLCQNSVTCLTGEPVTPEEPEEPGTPEEPEEPGKPEEPEEPVKPVEPEKPVDPCAHGGCVTTPSTDALIAMGVAPRMIFNAHLPAWRTRSGDTGGVKRQQEQVNARFLGGTRRYQGAANSEWKMQSRGVEVAINTPFAFEGGEAYFGPVATFSSQTLTDRRGANGQVDSWGIGLEASWVFDNGAWIDTLLTTSRYDHRLGTRMSSGTEVSGEWARQGFGAALESGYRIATTGAVWLEPYARLTAFTAGSKNVALDNGMRAHFSRDRSLMGEAGLYVGGTLQLASLPVTPWLKAAMSYETLKGKDTVINDRYRFDNDFSGASATYAAGVSLAVSDTTRLFGEIGGQKGASITAPLNASLGVNIAF